MTSKTHDHVGERANAGAHAQADRHASPVRPTCTHAHHCDHETRQAVLRRSPVFGGLDDDQVAAVDGLMTVRSWEAGEALFHEGDPLDSLWVVAQGHVALSRVDADGQEVITDLLAPGDMTGALAATGGAGRASGRGIPSGAGDAGSRMSAADDTARALETTCALAVDPSVFRRILGDYPDVAVRLLEELSGRVATLRTHVGRRSAGSVAQRVAGTLVDLAERVGERREDGSVLLKVPLSRADLAKMSGTTVESTSRTMSGWRRDGVIDSGRQWTAILDMDRMHDIADGAGAADGAAGA